MSVLIVTLPGHTHTTTACPVPPPLHHLSHSQKGLPWNSHSRGAGGGALGRATAAFWSLRLPRWPTTSHSNPVITPCLQARKGREGRRRTTP